MDERMPLLLLSLLLCIRTTVGSDEDDLENEGFLVPKQYLSNVERYDDTERQKTYLFWFQNQNWDMAQLMCTSQKASLAEPQTLEEANFLSQAMAESEETDFEDMWIGGHLLEDGKTFGYLHSHITLPFEQKKVKGTLWPPWANFSEETDGILSAKFFNHVVRKCLGMDRRGHDVAQFVNLVCQSKRPFICEKSMDPFVEPIPLWPKFKSDDHMYLIVRARATWEQAVAWCLTNKMTLGVTDNMQNVHDIAYQMLRTRPVIENAWLGGHYNNERQFWEWLHWPVPLGSSRDSKTGYPPWYKGTPSVNKGAMLIDRHLSTDTVFISARVTRRRDFVCMDEPSSTIQMQWFQISRDWFMYLGKTSWIQVELHCEMLAPEVKDEKKKPRFLMLKKKEELEKLVRLVAWFQISIRHLWLGAQMEVGSKQWFWDDGSPFSNEYSFLPWCEPHNETRDINRCLNFDREDHYRPVVYGLACHFLQNFICEVPELQCSPEECKIQTLSATLSVDKAVLAPVEGTKKLLPSSPSGMYTSGSTTAALPSALSTTEYVPRTTSEEVPSTSERVPTFPEEVTSISEDVMPTSEEVVHSSEEVMSTSEEVAPSSEVPPTSEEVVPSSEEVMHTSEEVVPSSEEVPPTSEEVTESIISDGEVTEQPYQLETVTGIEAVNGTVV